MDHNHYFDGNGAYLSSSPANAGSLPPRNATRERPPSKSGFWPVRSPDGGGWTLAEDHRGRTGRVGGREARIGSVGPLPPGWTDSPPAPADARTPEERRRDDFAAEADPLRNQALAYQAEADALLLIGEKKEAAAMTKKRRHFLAAYLEKKREIRARHPGGGAGAAAPEE